MARIAISKEELVHARQRTVDTAAIARASLARMSDEEHWTNAICRDLKKVYLGWDSLIFRRVQETDAALA